MARPWERKFLGFSFTNHKQPGLDRLFWTMRNSGSARQARPPAPTTTLVDGMDSVETGNHAISRTPQARHRCLGGRANCGQLRRTVAPCEHTSVENRSVKRLLCLARASQVHCQWIAQLAEPPDADPHVRWCGWGERATTPPIPIGENPSQAAIISAAAIAERRPCCGMPRSASVRLRSPAPLADACAQSPFRPPA